MRSITETVKHLIIINGLFFLATMLYGDVMYGLFSLWFVEHPSFGFWQIFTHMFMHGGLTHIFFNMYALWAFGGALEHMWGGKKFLFFYLSAGLGAALIHTGVNYYFYLNGIQALEAGGFAAEQVISLLGQGQYSPAWYEAAGQDTVNAMIEAVSTPALRASLSADKPLPVPGKNFTFTSSIPSAKRTEWSTSFPLVFMFYPPLHTYSCQQLNESDCQGQFSPVSLSHIFRIDTTP